MPIVQGGHGTVPLFSTLVQSNDYTGASDINSGDTGAAGIYTRFLVGTSGPLEKVEHHVDSPAMSGVTVGVYDGTSTAPGSLISEETSQNSSATSWHTTTFSSQPVLTSGNYYWIRVSGGTWALSYATTGTGTFGVYWNSTWRSTWAVGHKYYQLLPA